MMVLHFLMEFVVSDQFHTCVVICLWDLLIGAFVYQHLNKLVIQLATICTRLDRDFTV